MSCATALMDIVTLPVFVYPPHMHHIFPTAKNVRKSINQYLTQLRTYANNYVKILAAANHLIFEEGGGVGVGGFFEKNSLQAKFL